MQDALVLTIKEALGLVYPEFRRYMTKSIINSYSPTPAHAKEDPYFQELPVAPSDMPEHEHGQFFVYEGLNFKLRDRVYAIDNVAQTVVVEEYDPVSTTTISPHTYYLLVACMRATGFSTGKVILRSNKSRIVYTVFDYGRFFVGVWESFVEFLSRCSNEIRPHLASDTRVFTRSLPLPRHSLCETEDMVCLANNGPPPLLNLDCPPTISACPTATSILTDWQYVHEDMYLNIQMLFDD